MSHSRAPLALVALLAAAAPSQAAPPAGGAVPAFLAARLATGKDGCLGLAKNGKKALFLYDGQVQLLDLQDKLQPAEVASTWPVAAFTDALRADADVARTIADARLVACRAGTPDKGGLVVAKSVPVRVDGDIDVGIEGNAAVHLDTQHESFSDELEAVYWADDVGPIVVVTNNEVQSRAFIAIGPTLLGNALGSCVARPHGGKPAAGEPPAFAVKAPGPVDINAPSDCLALSKDGRHAAFRMWATNDDDPSEVDVTGVQWFGKGPAPDVDLGCLVAAGGCTGAAKDALAARAAALGLTACAVARDALAVDGQALPARFGGNAVVVTGSNGPATLWEAKSGHTITSEYEGLGRAFQHPRGGTLFLAVGVSVTPGTALRVYALDEPELGFCAAVPGLLPVAEVKASSAAADGNGYRYGAKLVADGDLTTAWQPAAPKAGDASAPWVELTLAAPATVASVEIGNGFQRKDGNGDMFTANARAATATLTFSDGSHETVTFAPDARGLVRFDVAPRTTSSVRVTIDSQHAGARWPKDLALSEVRLYGAR